MSQKDSLLKFILVGDVCVNTPITKSPLTAGVEDLLRSADYTICNLEGPLGSDTIMPITKAGPHKSQQKGYEYLVNSNNFSAVTLANNHIMDYGKDGLNSTIHVLEKNGIKHFGAGLDSKSAHRPLILRKGSVRVAALSVCEAQFGCMMNEDKPGYAWLFSDKLPALIRELKQENDAVIIFAHGGLELVDVPLPEFRNLYKSLVDSGADLILASHPHVIQGRETYKGKSIYYSVGNFFFNSEHPDKRWNQSLAVECTVESKGSAISITTNEHFLEFKEGQIHIDVSGTAKQSFVDNSEILRNSKIYIERVDTDCLSTWERYYKSYYGYAQYNDKYDDLSKTRKRFIDRIVKKYLIQGSDIMIYHNIRIEPHRFAVQRALELLYKVY